MRMSNQFEENVGEQYELEVGFNFSDSLKKYSAQKAKRYMITVVEDEENENCCEKCIFKDHFSYHGTQCKKYLCNGYYREDGKNVHFEGKVTP